MPVLIGRRRFDHRCLWARLPVIDVWECLHGYSIAALEMGVVQPPLEET